MGFLATGNEYLLTRYVRTDLFEIVLEQFLFELLELTAGCTHQILSAALADGHQVLLAHHAAIEDPYPSGLSMFALDGAQNCFDGANIGAVPIEEFVAERKAVRVDDQRQNQLLAVRTMIPRVAPPHHGLCFRSSFHILAGHVI